MTELEARKTVENLQAKAREISDYLPDHPIFYPGIDLKEEKAKYSMSKAFVVAPDGKRPLLFSAQRGLFSAPLTPEGHLKPAEGEWVFPKRGEKPFTTPKPPWIVESDPATTEEIELYAGKVEKIMEGYLVGSKNESEIQIAKASSTLDQVFPPPTPEE